MVRLRICKNNVLRLNLTCKFGVWDSVATYLSKRISQPIVAVDGTRYEHLRMINLCRLKKQLHQVTYIQNIILPLASVNKLDIFACTAILKMNNIMKQNCKYMLCEEIWWCQCYGFVALFLIVELMSTYFMILYISTFLQITIELAMAFQTSSFDDRNSNWLKDFCHIHAGLWFHYTYHNCGVSASKSHDEIIKEDL